MQAGFLLHKPKTNVPAGESETYKITAPIQTRLLLCFESNRYYSDLMKLEITKLTAA